MRGNGTENLQGKREGRKVREVREKKEGRGKNISGYTLEQQ